MADYVHSKVHNYTIDGQDISEWTNKSEWGGESDKLEVSGFGMNSKRYRPGLDDASISVEGSYYSGATGPAAILEPLRVSGEIVPYVDRPEGVGSTLPQKRCDVFVQSYTETRDVADMIKWKATLQKTDETDYAPQS